MAFVSNHEFPRHSHDQFGIGILERGGQRSWSSAGTVRASPGDVIMVNPGEIHDGTPLGGTPREWKIIYLAPEIVARETGEDFVGADEIVRPVASDLVLGRSLLELFNCLVAANGEALEREEKLLRAVICLFRRHGTAKFDLEEGVPCIRKAVDRIRADPARNVSLKELADLAGLSRFQLLRSFSRRMGITPHAFLIQCRVIHAQQLLRGGQPVAQVAVETGFSDQSHLTRVFARQVGVTPGCYRSAFA
jgi:AraC-like DNA-binding protein